MPIEELMTLLQRTTEALSRQIEEVGVSEGSYQRSFWTEWQKLPYEDLSIAAMNRECEMRCRALREVVTLDQSLCESYRAKRDTLAAILAARTA